MCARKPIEELSPAEEKAATTGTMLNSIRRRHFFARHSPVSFISCHFVRNSLRVNELEIVQIFKFSDSKSFYNLLKISRVNIPFVSRIP